MISLVVLLGGLAASDSIPRELTTSEPDGSTAAAAIVVHRQPGVPIVALRMSILENDPAGYAGAGHMIQHLLYPSLQDRAARVGGRVQIQRTADALVYTVTGPAAELTYLARVLVSALDPGQPEADAILRADRELREERLAEWETAQGHARSMLRAQLFPADISAAGTDRSATRFTPSAMPAIWAQLYHPARVAVLAVGDVFLADVQREFSELPARRNAPSLPIDRDSVILGSLAPPQATNAWVGSAYLATDLEPAAVTVAARLVGDRVRRSVPTAQVDAEHWWTHHGQAVAIIVSAPERDLGAARRAVGTAVGSLLEELDFLSVLDAATAIRREMLFYSRTPDRMAELIGQFVDRQGDPNAVERYYRALDSLDDRDVRSVLQELLERSPARVEIPPQALQPRRR